MLFRSIRTAGVGHHVKLVSYRAVADKAVIHAVVTDIEQFGKAVFRDNERCIQNKLNLIEIVNQTAVDNVLWFPGII